MLRKGYARPSLAADSAAKILRRFAGTCFIANFPPERRIEKPDIELNEQGKHTNDSGADDRIRRSEASRDSKRRHE